MPVTKKPRPAKKPKAPKPIGAVTHFYGHLGVAIVKFSKPTAVGARLHFKGATTDFEDTVKSMQYDRASIETAPKGKEIGIKVKSKVREGDEVYATDS
ncbi:MAG: hypothetical protein A2945_02390 [Candidatus Liptonbacteria bacterium RIFCSPLOWO2_01_FULL_52_25]|uniref:Translation elongation factor-like protein n=1 Tax=Candidatus Liptonbacteria bacterium RIFCSPLOWO2_01_FULL_52_25 TaxID=1798650 RepID=A0A1G2CF32_9BACT|nr:MAG: hypothetical protein A2945_02390 [Candidatus Liptonbacteria bacterium RIFCSPLOWO2_01_FULL_52_25]